MEIRRWWIYSEGLVMGKNLQATVCLICHENLCYYGTKSCPDCQEQLATSTPNKTIELLQKAISGGEE